MITGGRERVQENSLVNLWKTSKTTVMKWCTRENQETSNGKAVEKREENEDVIEKEEEMSEKSRVTDEEEKNPADTSSCESENEDSEYGSSYQTASEDTPDNSSCADVNEQRAPDKRSCEKQYTYICSMCVKREKDTMIPVKVFYEEK